MKQWDSTELADWFEMYMVAQGLGHLVFGPDDMQGLIDASWNGW